ncbi:hypothetical protein ECANGB1_52 [Enterospora canceri]|uniref:Uncharacterized protein n=1 Tax=Enterospora canceri TaxID=1081671 RepID=A0A1Y1S8E8_9MICR|nr:hypothetical protein ECANGB1_52 [Enterospora canceri]
MDNIPLLVQVIRGLIDYINHDSFVVKAKHFNTVRAYASRLLASYPVPDETEGIEELKPIQEINLDNYRSQFRHFINNLIYVYDLRALVKFNGCFNKAAIDIRLDVLELLIGLINITDLYREFVQEQTVIMKKVRALQDAVAVRKRGETANQSEMSAMGRELDEIGLNHIRSPIRAFLGRFSEYALVYFDRSVVLAINESKAYAFRKREQLQQFMGTIDRKHRGGRLLHSNLSDLVSLSGMTN